MDSGKNRREKDRSEKGGGKENTGEKKRGEENSREKESVTLKRSFLRKRLRKCQRAAKGEVYGKHGGKDTSDRRRRRVGGE